MRYQSLRVNVQAIQLVGISITFDKWVGVQHAKAGDWLISKAGDVYRPLEVS